MLLAAPGLSVLAVTLDLGGPTAAPAPIPVRLSLWCVAYPQPTQRVSEFLGGVGVGYG